MNLSKHTYSCKDVRLGVATWQQCQEFTMATQCSSWFVRQTPGTSELNQEHVIIWFAMTYIYIWHVFLTKRPSTYDWIWKFCADEPRWREVSSDGCLLCMWTEPMTAPRLCQSCHLWAKSWIRFIATRQHKTLQICTDITTSRRCCFVFTFVAE